MTQQLKLEWPLKLAAGVAQEAFKGDPGAWLPLPVRVRRGEIWEVSLGAGPVSRRVQCELGPAWSVNGDIWRTLSWRPFPEPGDVIPGDKLLPALEGEIGIQAAGSGNAVLVLYGNYRPPGGVLGSFVDAAALTRVAHVTAERFLADIGRRLEAAGA